MKILIVSDHYPPFIGGAHLQTRRLGRELRRRGHDVTIATCRQDGLPSVHLDDGVPVYRLAQVRTYWPRGHNSGRQRHQPPYPDPVTVWQLRRLITRVRPDVVHSYGWIGFSCSVALLGLRVPLLLSGRDYGYSCATRTLAYKNNVLCDGPALTRCVGCAAHHYGPLKGTVAAIGVRASRGLLRRKTRGFHGVSAYVVEMARRDFLGPAGATMPREVIPSFGDEGAADEGAAQAHEYLQRLPPEPFILFVGALRVVKGVRQLLAAYQQLPSPPPLVLVGTVEADSPRAFPDGVTVLENVPHAAVMAIWERALFGVLPSLWPEPFGSVVHEGMRKGKAVIGTTPGGHADMILDGETGLLVPAGDVEALTHAMQELIDDAELRERLGRAACERARLFTAGVAVPRFEALYRRLAGDGTAG